MNDVTTHLESVMIFAEAGQLDRFQSSLSAFKSHKDAHAHLVQMTYGSCKALHYEYAEQSGGARNKLTSADKHMQQQLPSSAKALAEALQSLLAAAMTAAGKPGNDPAIQDVTDAVKAQFSSVADIIRVVKLLSDESSREAAKAVVNSVYEIVSSTSDLIPSGYADPEDPNVVAERELLNAANDIEAVAKSVGVVAPTPTTRGLSGQMLDATKAIAAATAALVHSATAAQRGIVPKQVCAATTQLITAAQVSGDHNSSLQIRLRAGKAVTGATEQLVRAAEEPIKFDDTETNCKNTITSTSAITSPTNANVLEMEAQMSVLKMEKELERARAKLASVRKGWYDMAKSKGSPTLATSATSTIASPLERVQANSKL
ncbi:I/LWEQ domain-containing protein [Cladochytrium replicatum]|nr:I/LWEQ domain-containing protein [Cladochytrium replicatum]